MAHFAPIHEMIVTGGKFNDTALASVEAFNLGTGEWSNMPALPYKLVDHVMSDLGRPTVLGGRLAGMPISMVLEYVESHWTPTNYLLPAKLAGHSITAYPKDLVTC